MDSKCYLSEKNAVCNESVIKQSLLRRSHRNKEESSVSSISPSMSISVGENSVIFQNSALYHMNEIDRLISDQGLITPKGRRPNTSKRKIKDKSYYKGLIHLKTKEVCDEIRKLKKEISLLSIDQRMYMPYMKKAESKATDLQNLQKKLAEYNFLDDMLHRDIQLDESKKQLQELKAINMRENAKVEKLFAMTEQKKAKAKELETNITQENNEFEILAKTMNSEICEKLKNLKCIDYRLQKLRTEQQEELMDLRKEQGRLDNQCGQNEVLKEGLELIKKLWSTEEKRNEFYSGNEFASLQEEYEYLQKYEAECDILLKGIRQESQNIQNKIKDTTEEMKKIENESYNPYYDLSFKYLKLRKQENVIDEFFSSYTDEQQKLLTKRQEEECKIVKLLKEIGNKINSFNCDFQNEKGKKTLTYDDLMIEEKKMEYIKATRDWGKCINTELTYLKDRDNLEKEIKVTENKILIVSNIDKAKEDLKIKEMKLLYELNQIKKQKCVWNHILRDLKKRYDSLREQLYSNQTYTMLSKLEKRWHLLEKEKLAMENTIASKDFRKEYALLKGNVRKLYLELNSML